MHRHVTRIRLQDSPDGEITEERYGAVVTALTVIRRLQGTSGVRR